MFNIQRISGGLACTSDAARSALQRQSITASHANVVLRSASSARLLRHASLHVTAQKCFTALQEVFSYRRLS